MEYAVAERGGSFEEREVDKGIPAENPFTRFFDIWFEYINGGEEPPFSGRNNLKVFALLSAAIDSIETGGSVRIADNPKYKTAF
jgi:hypothetical protein